MAFSLQYRKMMRLLSFFPILLVLLVLTEAHGKLIPSPGYVSNVTAEKSQRFYEVYLFVPNPSEGPSLKEMIFSPLTKEFKAKYREKFGQLDTDSIVYRSPSIGGSQATPAAIQQENQNRRDFAEYMTKRLAEFHVDQYMRTQPAMKPVMEVKEKIQNVKVEVSKEVRFNIQYNFAGNTADVVLDNPWCDSKLSVEMDPKSFGPTSPSETRIWVGRNLNSYLRVNSNIALTDGVFSSDLTRTFPRFQIATSLGLSSAYKPKGISIRETKYLIGFSRSF